MNVTTRTRWSTGALCVLCICVAGVLLAGKPVQDPFRAFFRNGTDRITDDGLGEYASGVHGVVTHFPSSGNFIFDTDGNVKKNETVIRTIRLVFDADDVVSPNGSPEFFNGASVLGSYDAAFMSVNGIGEDCDGNDGPAPRDMVLGDCIKARVGVNFPNPFDSKSSLMLRCGPKPSDALDRSGTDAIKVVCVDGSAADCVQWRIEPFPLGPSGSERFICRLFEHIHAKKVHSTLKVADFNMAFGFEAFLQ